MTVRSKFFALALACLAALIGAAGECTRTVNPNIEEFRKARFGLFLHWGLYSQLGGRWKGETMAYIGEWIQAKFRIPNTEYAALAKEFNPVEFNAENWVSAAKAAGVNYLVFTAKHHEGFSMFATKASDYNIVEATPFKRDVFAELAAACRKHDMKVCFYYSQCLDWHEYDASDVVSSRGGNFGMDWGNSWDWPDASGKDVERYLKGKVYPQLKELLTNYGDIFYIWFDCPMGMTREQTAELREYVRKLSPSTLVNSRIGYGLCDVGSMGDNQEFSGKVSGLKESPITINDTWGFKWDDHNFKSGYEIACMLAQTVSCNANLLLNIGPRPDGALPEESLKTLAELAEWRKESGYEIYGAKPNPFPGDFPWGWCTVAADGALQFIVRNEWTNDLEIAGIENRIIGSSHKYEIQDGVLRISLPPVGSSRPVMPRVVRVKLEGEIKIDPLPQPQNGTLVLLPQQGEIVSGGTGGGKAGGVGAAHLPVEPAQLHAQDHRPEHFPLQKEDAHDAAGHRRVHGTAADRLRHQRQRVEHRRISV